MPRKARNELSYYDEITEAIGAQLKSNFLAHKKRALNVYWKIGELSSKLQELVRDHPAECSCFSSFAHSVPPLNLDIFAVITDGSHFELLILEVKLVPRVGLSEWSQLVGYCIVSDARFGLLVNIDAGGSQRLTSLLAQEKHISNITRLKDGVKIEHLLGFMQWNSLTRNFEYSNLGELHSLSILCSKIEERFP